MNAYFIINIDVTAYRSLHNDFFYLLFIYTIRQIFFWT